MLSPVRVDPPAEVPVTLQEVKAHLRVDHSYDDARLTALIQQATDQLDGWSGILGRALVTQSWRWDMRTFPYCHRLQLPLIPVQSITSIAYWDFANADQVYAASNYSLNQEFVELVRGSSWPTLYFRADAVRITFVVGYGNAAAVPTPLKQAIKLLVDLAYDGEDEGKRRAFDSLIGPFRVRKI
jgi:uncharacterized phiE125 gp8 family phage protein